ncbi:hypothetical protein C7999DRAFT_10723 [Corynascus novoguineensis]|uniref:DUF7053 domain-containing protein n=1 Tax=Corynascus novoguineensis TaxID=1126955 RepID=A0AAN7D037_9PEZI|nr:hypothetical protein C7999DRAFT_10723 [Corynascus novoguineensis]
MAKRSIFTTVTPLPAGISRQIVIDFLHDHEEMIDLNPLVKERHPIPPPGHASADEQLCQWYSLTDKISYFPGVAGDVTYSCAFNDLSNGVQTHCYAPAGLTIREKWSVGGSLPGEPPQPIELGLQLPPVGLYLREDVDMRCNVVMTGFVKKTLKKSHAALVERLKIKAEIASTKPQGRSRTSSNGNGNVSGLSRPATLESIGMSSISNQSYNPAAPEPTSRSSSAASSASSYSVWSNSLWSQAASSVGTSPPQSVSGTSTAHGSHYQFQSKPYLDEYMAQPKHQQAAQPATSPESLPQLASATLSPPTPPTPVPNTPFLRSSKPDWSLKQSVPSSQQQQQSNWPLKAAQQPPAPYQQQQSGPRPQTHFFVQAYRPPPVAHDGGRQDGKLSDDALWQALGGGRRGVDTAEAAARNNWANADAAFEYNGLYARARARSQGQEGSRALYGGEHPEYPHMNPYRDEENDQGEKSLAATAAEAATPVGPGEEGVRRVSMPPPALWVGPVSGMSGNTAALSRPFAAELDA